MTRRWAVGGRRPWATGLVACLAAGLPGAQEEEQAEERVRILYAPSPATERWEAVDAGTPPSPGVDDAWPDWNGTHWLEPEPWARWVALLEAEVAPEAGAERARRRASLARLALLQGRHGDAWTHFAAVDDPAVLAALMPAFFPGVPRGTTEAGGRSAPLPDGVRLAPALPPPRGIGLNGHDYRGELELDGLTIGAAAVRLRLSVQPDGVQVDLEHTAGGTARVRLVVPLPPDRVLERAYVDWDEVSEPPAVFELEVGPPDAEHPERGERKIWLRLRPLAPACPGRLPAELPAAIRRGGLVLADDGDARLEGFCAALTALLGIECRVAAHGTPGTPGGPDDGAVFAPPLVRPASTPGRGCSLEELVSRVEAFHLARTDTDAHGVADEGDAR